MISIPKTIATAAAVTALCLSVGTMHAAAHVTESSTHEQDRDHSAQGPDNRAEIEREHGVTVSSISPRGSDDAGAPAAGNRAGDENENESQEVGEDNDAAGAADGADLDQDHSVQATTTPGASSGARSNPTTAQQSATDDRGKHDGGSDTGDDHGGDHGRSGH